jgi:hypothetical protein
MGAGGGGGGSVFGASGGGGGGQRVWGKGLARGDGGIGVHEILADLVSPPGERQLAQPVSKVRMCLKRGGGRAGVGVKGGGMTTGFCERQERNRSGRA